MSSLHPPTTPAPVVISRRDNGATKGWAALATRINMVPASTAVPAFAAATPMVAPVLAAELAVAPPALAATEAAAAIKAGGMHLTPTPKRIAAVDA